MKIKLGMLDHDLRYMRRLSDYFNTYYADKLEISAFSSLETLNDALPSLKPDVILANYDLEQGKLSESNTRILAYFSEAQDTETICGVKAVCKYQKAEQIYKAVLNLYAELDLKTSFHVKGGSCPAHLFMGVAGGVGTTTAAVAFATQFAQAGKRVLYLNLEENGVLSPFLKGDGTTGLSDALYAIKSNHANVGLRLQTIVRKDESGVCFFAPFEVSLDAAEMTAEDTKELMRLLVATDMFDCIVVDASVAISEKRSVLMNLASQIYLVNDGSVMANEKLAQVLRVLQITDERDEARNLAKCNLLYNKYTPTSTQAQSALSNKVVGVVARYESASPKRVVDELLQKNIFAALVVNA